MSETKGKEGKETKKRPASSQLELAKPAKKGNKRGKKKGGKKVKLGEVRKSDEITPQRTYAGKVVPNVTNKPSKQKKLPSSNKKGVKRKSLAQALPEERNADFGARQLALTQGGEGEGAPAAADDPTPITAGPAKKSKPMTATQLKKEEKKLENQKRQLQIRKEQAEQKKQDALVIVQETEAAQALAAAQEKQAKAAQEQEEKRLANEKEQLRLKATKRRRKAS